MQYRKPLNWVELLDDDTRVEFLLSVTYAGTDFYFSTEPRVLLDELGRPIQYLGGLRVQWTDALDLFNESPSLLAIPIKVVFPVNVAELVSKGHDLFRAKGELSLWVEGRTYEERVILVRGSAVQPNYEAGNQEVSFSLESNGFEDVALTHTATERITALTFPDAHEDAFDIYYPIVFGRPGVYTTAEGTQAVCAGSPCPVIKVTAPNRKALICGHDIEATEVTLINVSNDPPTTVVQTILNEQDGLGQTVKTVNLSGGIAYTVGDEIWAIWDRDGGGMLNDRRTGARIGAGELIIHFLRQSSLEVDIGIWSSVETYLNQNYILAGYIDDAVSPWSYIKDNFLPLVPLSVFSNSEGIACSLWRREAKKHEAVAHITAGGGTKRSSKVQYEKQKIRNDIRINYAYDGSQDRTIRNSAVVGDREPNVAVERDLFSTEYSRASFFRYGTASSKIETDVIYDTATAINVLQWKHRAQALPYRVISYNVPIRLGFLIRGDLVLLTDDELYIKEYLCIVRDIVWTDGRPRVSLVLIDDPPREDRD